ncbi:MULTISPECIES: EF-P lysine aminoacylase EpmA [Commensalibacter]|uniref:Lysyl-tRNA synthetase n=2 Tax=Commensalibacter TaxID=1079922 RepID=W7E0I4_9PROT|nr:MULTISPECIES: EF-P lysine aminoacylase EpmA [Commensalibacter]EUK18489.1 lysyl-tRNA synthetase [Commensalibacter papalotli (ex Servin-Garciduenas et al. 2014)]CAI3932882.1 Elongation factor P--beta-lysine ligase (EF-P beta-lysylation pathway) (EpmA) (PDB:3A5Z) (PUBMED:20729861) [Commensalibacter papalotli (ex Botero et al. 2024)]CAI3942785.1 Elongation factor P--beta-lysine ligase (EF-P beta-lysylation pathway) (EpmA) (PDB:3A5Z) (PUBMED:20729861) [Commensalibacter papalotli (ex Botero et al. 
MNQSDCASLVDRLPLLKRRQLMIKAIRSFFDAKDYLEVETSYLVQAPGEEVHLNPFHTIYETPYGEKRILFLHTSPEFAMKRIMAELHQPVYQLARVWRNKEGGPNHSPEFTMLEWYHPYCSLTELMNETEQLCKNLLPCEINYQNQKIRFDIPFEKLTIQEAFQKFVGVDILSLLDDERRLADAVGYNLRDHETWEDLFFRLLLDKIEPNIGRDRPTFLTHWPVQQAALAKIDPHDHRVALRFELYAGGLELANAFEELTDPIEQRKRFITDRSKRAVLYPEAPQWEMDEAFLQGLSKMPPCSGIAMGVDRLVMLATGAKNIRDILWI